MIHTNYGQRMRVAALVFACFCMGLAWLCLGGIAWGADLYLEVRSPVGATDGSGCSAPPPAEFVSKARAGEIELFDSCCMREYQISGAPYRSCLPLAVGGGKPIEGVAVFVLLDSQRSMFGFLGDKLAWGIDGESVIDLSKAEINSRLADRYQAGKQIEGNDQPEVSGEAIQIP